MHAQRRTLAGINVIGGLAVLGSYAWGIATHPGSAGDVWGGVPAGLQPVYTVSMLTAAVGYFAFTYFVFFRVDPEDARIGSSGAYPLLNGLYALILFPSALWMPLTFAMLDGPDGTLWLAIRVVLAAVGIGSVGLLLALLALRPRRPAWAYWLAIVGLSAFCLQTALLDALVWPAFFPL